MAETATTICGWVWRYVFTRSAMARIFSAVATELPPYFCTTIGPKDISFWLLLCDRRLALLHERVELALRAAKLHGHFHARGHHLGGLVAVAGDTDDDRLVARDRAVLDELPRARE